MILLLACDLPAVVVAGARAGAVFRSLSPLPLLLAVLALVLALLNGLNSIDGLTPVMLVAVEAVVLAWPKAESVVATLIVLLPSPVGGFTCRH